MEESPSSTKSFTVQFLPERLAVILAQAERYARQTLLPLISQYTPSFVSAGRNERLKYFPPLGDIVTETVKEIDFKELSNQSVERESNTDKSNDPKANVVSMLHSL